MEQLMNIELDSALQSNYDLFNDHLKPEKKTGNLMEENILMHQILIVDDMTGINVRNV